MKVIKGLNTAISFISQVLFGLSTLVLVVVTVMGTIMRYVLGSPLTWVEEIQLLLMVWMTFFGGCIAFEKRGNIAITLFVDRFPQKIQKGIEILVWLITAAILAVVMVLEYDRMLTLISTMQSSAVLRIPRFVNYGVVCFACLLMLLCHLLNGVTDVLTHKKREEAQENA